MRRWGRLLVLALLLPTLGACDDGPFGFDDNDEEELQQEMDASQVAFLRLVIGSTTIVIDQAGTVIGQAVTIGPPNAAITAFPLDSNSQPLRLDSTAFRLDVTPDATGRITFARTGVFSGEFTRNGPGPAKFAVALFHTTRNHQDFGPDTVHVTVQ
jgi:hypothetical protein